MAINVGGAPLGRPAARAADLLPRRSLAQQVALEGDANRPAQVPEVAQYDPRDLVRERLADPEAFAAAEAFGIDPVTGPPVDAITTMEDVAAVSGSPFGANETDIPIVDDDNNPVIDPATGQLAMRRVEPADYDSTLQQERASQLGIEEDIRSVANDPATAIDAAQRMMRARNAATEGGNTRQGQYDEDYIKRTADESGSPLINAVLFAREALLSQDSLVTMEHMEEGAPTTHYAAGRKILFDAGVDSPEDQNTIATVFGVAAAKAASQVPVTEGQTLKKADRSIVRDHTGNAVPDGMFLGDYINSIKHFAANGLRNAGLTVEPAAVEQLAKVMALTAETNGDAYVVDDKNTGKRYVTMSAAAKTNARELERLAEVMLGDRSRGRSSTTPNPSGAGLTDPRQLFTKKSFGAKGLVTSAAEATKDINGRIGTVFRAKDVKFKSIGYNDIFSKVEEDPETGTPLYSMSPFAEREGVSQDYYEAAMQSAKIPENLRGGDPKAIEAYRAKHAAEVMHSKFKAIEFDMANIEGSKGVRFTKYMHSLSNQRMFPANFDTDYMSSKNTIRDTMGLAKQDLAYKEDLFDPVQVQRNQQKFYDILRMDGEKKHDALMRLSPREQGAIGTMFTTVVNYYTTIDPQPTILKTVEADAIKLYRPEMALKLAELGKQYNEWLENPDMEADIVRYLAGMERGESMGAKNLWDDLFQLSAKANGQPMALTHHNFDDGNQNGIFLQALFFGSTNNATRLGIANPSQEDMRGAALNKMKLQLENLLTDRKEQLLGWKSFLNAAEEEMGRNTLAKILFKAPLMQNSYSKHASMFRDYLYEVMDEHGPKFEGLLKTHLEPLYKDKAEMYGQFGAALEGTLGELVNAKYAEMMKAIGRYTAIVDSTVFMELPTGDTGVFTAVGAQPVNKNFDDSTYTEKELPSGQKVYMKLPNRVVDTFRTPDGDVQIESMVDGYNPSASKGSQMHLRRRTQTYDKFNNALGTSQSRMMAVMPIQSLDGDLLKWTTLFVNRGLKTPVPALWVHDSIISTPFGSLVYRNAYNNVAIKNAIPYIADFGKMFEGLVTGAEQQAVQRAKESVTQFGTPKPVGIGEQGDFPALGAFFDEMHEKVNSPTYKADYLSSPNRTEKGYNEYMTRLNKILDEARKYGWVSESEMPRRARQYLATSPKDFEKLLYLSKETLKLAGPQDQLRSWAMNFPGRVKATAKALFTQGKFFGNTLFQMSHTGGSKPLKALPKWEPKPKAAEKQEEDKKTAPKSIQYKRADVEDAFDTDSNPFD
jgi:hypothetical protein